MIVTPQPCMPPDQRRRYLRRTVTPRPWVWRGCSAATVAIGYVCNRMGPELVGDPRTTGLCKAILGAAQTP